MEKNSKIYVAGHRGLVGSSIVNQLKILGYNNLILKSSSELDLTNQVKVNDFFAENKPDYVFLAAAKVGGIHSNNIYPADFIYKNLMIQTNVIHASYIFKVKRLLFMSSGCIYPKFSPQPIKEEYILTSELEKTNEAYAVAKIAGVKMCEYYNHQFKTNYLSVFPANLYGYGDNFNLENSHVIPALLRKFHEAKISLSPTVTVWGSGKAKREFLFSNDLADATVFLMNSDLTGNFNVGIGHDISIFELALLIQKVVNYQGKIIFDKSMPDGTPRKLLDSSKILSMGWKPKTNLEEGLKIIYEDYKININKYRS